MERGVPQAGERPSWGSPRAVWSSSFDCSDGADLSRPCCLEDPGGEAQAPGRRLFPAPRDECLPGNLWKKSEHSQMLGHPRAGRQAFSPAPRRNPDEPRGDQTSSRKGCCFPLFPVVIVSQNPCTRNLRSRNECLLPPIPIS